MQHLYNEKKHIINKIQNKQCIIKEYAVVLYANVLKCLCTPARKKRVI